MASQGQAVYKIDGWIDGFEGLDHDAAEVGLPIWRAVTDVMFGRTQEAVHIITGNLKSSGHSDAHVEGDHIIGEVEYDAEYAIYEAGRGGNHDYITRARVATERQFEGALSDIWGHLAGRM